MSRLFDQFLDDAMSNPDHPRCAGIGCGNYLIPGTMETETGYCDCCRHGCQEPDDLEPAKKQQEQSHD